MTLTDVGTWTFYFNTVFQISQKPQIICQPWNLIYMCVCVCVCVCMYVLIDWLVDWLRAGRGFPDNSVCKQSTCNAGDPGLIPGSGISTAEGIGYTLQYSWVSLVAQLVKNPPAMWETWVRSLGWDDPLEKRKATHSRNLAWRIPWTSESMGSWGVGHDWMTFTTSLFSLIEGNRRRGKQNEMVAWPHQLNECVLEQTLGEWEGQGSLAYWSHGVTKSQIWLSDWTTTI